MFKDIVGNISSFQTVQWKALAVTKLNITFDLAGTNFVGGVGPCHNDT